MRQLVTLMHSRSYADLGIEGRIPRQSAGMASWMWSTPTIFTSIPLVRSTADRDRIQIKDLRWVEDPGHLDLFQQVLFGRQLLY